MTPTPVPVPPRMFMFRRENGRLHSKGLKCRTVSPGVYRFTPRKNVKLAGRAQVMVIAELTGKYATETCLRPFPIRENAHHEDCEDVECEGCIRPRVYELRPSTRRLLYLATLDPRENYIEIRTVAFPKVRTVESALKAQVSLQHADFQGLVYVPVPMGKAQRNFASLLGDQLTTVKTTLRK